MTRFPVRSILAAALLGLLGPGMVPRPVAADYAFSTIAAFDSANGSNPYAGVTIDAQGDLFGTTYGGGANNLGTVYEIAAGTSTITTLATFNGTNGQYPRADLTIDAQGNLYGTTAAGASGYGTAFEIAAGTQAISTLATFNAASGSGGLSGLTMDAQGNLYGTTFYTVFEIAAGTHALSTIATFNGAGGSSLIGDLTIDAQGNLYGTTSGGGANGFGTVFEIAAGTQTISTIATFNSANGADPRAGLTLDAQGNLYGTTESGGANGDGTVFEISAGTHALTTLTAFNGTNGANPVASVTLDAQGNLYGTTLNGGASGYGTVFEIPAGTSTVNTLVSFNLTNGANPVGRLTISAQGNLYGTTNAVGPGGGGTVFEISPGPANVPEIDPVSAQASLTLLTASLLIVFDRRVRVK